MAPKTPVSPRVSTISDFKRGEVKFGNQPPEVHPVAIDIVSKALERVLGRREEEQ